MNVVPFLCRMVLNLHQKRPSSVTSGCLFHRAIRREIAAPSFVLMAMVQQSYPRHPSFHHPIQREIVAPSFVLVSDGAAKLSSSSVIPPPNTTRNRSTIIRFGGDGAAKLSPSSVIPPHNTTRNRSTVIRFDGRWCSKVILVIRHSTAQYDAKLRCHHSF